MADYPGAIPAKPSINTSDMSAATAHTVDRGLSWDELRAALIELGLTPSGVFSTVRARLDDMSLGPAAVLHFTPVGNDDAPAGFSNWVTLGNLTVPAGCTTAIVDMSVTGVHATGTACSYWMQSRIGTAGPASPSEALIDFPGVADRRGISWPSLVTAPGTGTQALWVSTTRRTGTGALRADTESKFNALVTFRG